MVVYHLLGKTGWSTIEVNGTRRILSGNFQGERMLSSHFQDVFSEDKIKGNPSQKA